MAEKVKKSIPWFLILALIGFTISVSFNFKTTEIKADSAAPTTTVTVGNDAPVFTANIPYETPACHSGAGTSGTADNPVNEGDNIVIKATATDANGNQYYLAVCDGPNPPTAADVADCASGTTFGKSSLTTQNTEATVTFAAPTITSESESWYTYACDSATTNKCSTVSQGTGNSGTPFYVNHRPTFTAVSDEAGNPGAADLTITAATTISGTDGYDDGDIDAAQDTVRLYVCKSAGFNSGASPGCTGDTWCSQTTGITPGSILTCDLTVPNPAAHGTDVQDYWPYIVDNHGFAATAGKQGSAEHYDVNDVAPTISGAVTLNDAGTIDLTGSEKSTKDIYVKGTITDDNGCGDIVEANVKADVWQTTLTTRTGCDSAGEGTAPNNKCYYHVTCVYDATVETCGAMPDKTGGYKCTVSFQYYTNPTDANTPWPADDWTATLIPGDGQGENAAGEADTAVAVEMQSFLALGLATSYDAIAYGSVAAGTNTDPLDELTRVEATGNCALDTTLHGTTMTGPGTAIAIANQRYASGSSAPAWADGTALLVTPGEELELNVCKSGYTATPEWGRVWWGIDIPSDQTAGEYTGTNTIEAVTAEVANWCN